MWDYKTYVQRELLFTFVTSWCSCNYRYIRRYQNGIIVTIWNHSYCKGQAKRATSCPPEIEITKQGVHILKPRPLPDTARKLRALLEMHKC